MSKIHIGHTTDLSTKKDVAGRPLCLLLQEIISIYSSHLTAKHKNWLFKASFKKKEKIQIIFALFNLTIAHKMLLYLYKLNSRA